MRRLWAYILLAFTSLLLVGVSFTPLMKNTSSNIDYQSGREIVFRVTDKEDPTKPLEEGVLESTADSFEERLANQGVTRYEIATQGDDTITITLSQDYEKQYSNLIQYMEFDGSFALSNSAGQYALMDEFRKTDEKASLETYNNYPCITLPVNIDNESYKAVIEGAKGEGAKPETTGEGDDQTSTYYMYLWYGFTEDLINEDTDYTSDSHIVMKFRIVEEGEDQYFPGSDNKLFSVVNLDSDGDGTASQSERKVAFDTANYYVNLLNASPLDVTVTHVGSNFAKSWIENIISLGTVSSVALSATFIATLVAIALVSILLVYFYRVGAVAVIVTTIVSLFAGLASMVLMTAEFTTISVFAFIALAIASIASGVVYLNKIKDEAYRGRSLKKANLEGGKKALLPIVDINVVLIVLGVFAYLLGGSPMRTFAAITVLGGIASLVLNSLGLKLLFWLATNATCLQGKYEAFGIESDKVPNLINEEKQTYFGPYAEKDLTKAKVKMGIGGGALLLASVVALTVFAIVTGSVYAPKTESYSDKIYFETEMSEGSIINDTTIRDILANTFVYTKDDKSDAKAISEKYGIDRIDSGKSYSLTDKATDETTKYYVTVVNLNGHIDANMKYYYKVSDTVIIDASDLGGDDDTFDNIIRYAIDNEHILENVATAELKGVSSYKVGQPDVAKIALSVFIGTLVAGFYLTLRYRLSRGIASTLLAAGSATIALGALSLIHLPVVGGYVAVISTVTALFSFILSIFFMNRERELIIDDRSKDNSLENRKAITVKATSFSYVAILQFALVSILSGVVFFGFGPFATSLNYIGLVLAMLVALIVSPIVIGPLANLFYGLFSRVNIKRPTKKKAKVKKVTKSAEPEEAIFIGIND